MEFIFKDNATLTRRWPPMSAKTSSFGMTHKLMPVGGIVPSPSCPLRLQHPFAACCILHVVDMWEVEEKTMQSVASQEQQLTGLSRIRRVHGQPSDPYELIFLDHQDHIIVPLTEWFRLRKEQGPDSTRKTYLACLQSYFI